MSGTCSVRTEKAGTTMSVSISNTSRAATLVSGKSIAEVGRISARVATLFIGWAVPVSSVESLTPAHAGARAAASPRGRHAGHGHQARAQSGVSKVDDLKSFLGCAVPAIGVRMVPLGQFLVARFHRVERCRPGETERRQRLTQLFLVPGGRLAQLAKRPGRALPRGVGTQLRLDLPRRHTLVVVPGRVV